tara:strand:+ start:145 stop:597 length:453 start_codon:yes stop_codon:yes gene_type:complete
MSELQKRAIWRIVNSIERLGNKPGILRQWIAGALKWADDNPGRDAQAIRDWVTHWQMRPFYTATELAPLIPALGVAFGITDKPMPQFGVKRLANMLDFAGLPKLKNIRGDCDFKHPYRCQFEEFYIVEQVHFWKDRELTQEEFENVAFSR